MVYNYFRDYDPTIGRYIQADPRGILLDFSDPQRQVALQTGIPMPDYSSLIGLNKVYGYVNQNPLSGSDPTGGYYNPGLLNQYKYPVERGALENIRDGAQSCEVKCFLVPGADDIAIAGGRALAKRVGGEAADQIIKRYIWPIGLINSLVCYKDCEDSCEN